MWGSARLIFARARVQVGRDAGSGDYRGLVEAESVPFEAREGYVTTSSKDIIGSEQGLIDDPVLGQGRDPLAPSQDVITDEGDIVVPV